MQNNKIITANRVIYQKEIFPELRATIGVLTNKHEQLIQMLDLLDLNKIYPRRLWDAAFGRPVTDRHLFVIAFIAKIMWNIGKTKDLIEYLAVDRALRVICGFDSRTNELPSESSFSRAFAELSELEVAEKIQTHLIREHCSDELYEHVSFDASAVEVAEKPQKIKNKKEQTVKAQREKSLAEILAELSVVADFGTKKNSNGKTQTWKGYKLHTIVNEYNIPLASIVTSASVHDSLCGIPLVRKTEELVDGLYYLGDKGYSCIDLNEEIESFGKIPLIDFKRNRNGVASGEFIGNQVDRYKKRTFVESVFSHLKMNYLPRYILYRGIKKVRSVLNIALAVITAMQIIKYA